jgi:hemerythrin-like metal-binding protein
MSDPTTETTEEGMYIDWDEKFTTGVDIVDKQHRGLIHILNGLYGGIGEGRGESALQGIFGELQHYADYHFDTEERLLKRHGVTPHHQAEHVIRHVAYRRRIEDFKARHDEGERLIPIQVLAFVSDWWLKHILNCDRIFETLADGAEGGKAAGATENVPWPAR